MLRERRTTNTLFPPAPTCRYHPLMQASTPVLCSEREERFHDLSGKKKDGKKPREKAQVRRRGRGRDWDLTGSDSGGRTSRHRRSFGIYREPTVCWLPLPGNGNSGGSDDCNANSGAFINLDERKLVHAGEIYRARVERSFCLRASTISAVVLRNFDGPNVSC